MLVLVLLLIVPMVNLAHLFQLPASLFAKVTSIQHILLVFLSGLHQLNCFHFLVSTDVDLLDEFIMSLH